MRLSWTPKEGKERSLSRLRKREFYEEQINKLPNELRHAFTNYNHRSVGSELHIDGNEYLFK